jgi:hypothetical protein
MALNPSEFKTRTPLDNISFKIINSKEDFVADRIFTPVYTDEKDIFQVYQYDARHLRNISSASSSKAEANRVDWGVFKRSYDSVLHKLKTDVDPRDSKTFDPAVADVRVDAADTIWSHLMVEREVAATTLATTAANYPSALTKSLVDGTSTFTSATGNVESEASIAHAALRAACGKRANAAVISATGFERIRAAPSVVSRIQYVEGSKATESQVANLLGVQELIIAGASVNSALEGAAASLADIWPDDILFFVKEASSNKRSMRYGAWYVRNEIYTHEAEDPKRGSADGRVSELEMGWEYVLAPGATVSASDGDFIAGYLLKNIIG